MTRSFARFAPPLLVLLLGCTALSGGASAGWFDSDDTPAAADKDKAAANKDTAGKDATKPAPAGDLESSVRQAQMLRLAGNYSEAVHHLSQLMMVASDDPRVISEYGKTLAAMGRAQDAVQFLTRAQQLSPGDWSVWSALGVAYDQMGNQREAGAAYERALQLKPGEPSVLNNYALSRMLAHDPDMARKLVSRAEVAGGGGDPKIARNIALINDMAVEAGAVDKSFAVTRAAPSPGPMMASTRPVTSAPLAPASSGAQAFVAAPSGPNGAPRQLVPVSTAPMAPLPDAGTSAGVVMQRVPFDPLAGPVASKGEKQRPPHPVAAARPVRKPAAKPEAVAAKPKDGVPGLRLSANAY